MRDEEGAYQLVLNSVILAGNGDDNFDAGVDANPNTGIFVVANASLDGDNQLPAGNPLNIASNSPQLGVRNDNGCAVPAGSPVDGDQVCVPTHLPKAGSPVIDSGSNPLPAQLTDQRGFARDKGDGPDIGATESGNSTTPGWDVIFTDRFQVRFLWPVPNIPQSGQHADIS